MPNDIQYHYNKLTTEASNYPELTDLEANTSSMSFWHYCKLTFAFGARLLETIFEQFKAEILSAIKQDYTVGKDEWYKVVLKEFQFGDELKVKYNSPIYETIDEAKKIVKRISVKDISTGGIAIKVQKEAAGEIVPLNAVELGAFIIYANRIKIAGTLLNITTQIANIVTFNAKIYISREVFDITGLNLITGKYDALDAMRLFVQKNEFDEFIYLSTLSDKMNDIEGIKAFHLTACTIDGTAVSLTTGKITLPNSYGKIAETDVQFNPRIVYEFV
jgi:hypothetical protein